MAPKVDRYDIIMIPQQRSVCFAPGVGVSIIRNLAVENICRPVAEAVAETWVEVYSEASSSAHDPFMKGAYDGAVPVFKEFVIRFGSKPCSIQFGDEDEAVLFFLEFRGVVFDDFLGEFRKRIADIACTGFDVYSRSHTKVPAHRKVPKSELPQGKKKKGGPSAGLVGTRVEEL